MDGVPAHLEYDKVLDMMKSQSDVKDVHHLHIWAISTTQNALTAHVLVDDIAEMEHTKEQLKAKLSEMGISHATLEFETSESHCCGECK